LRTVHCGVRPREHAAAAGAALPEILLHVADATVPPWRKTEPELAAMGLPSPFWAFALAGGQAFARYVLDHRKEVIEAGTSWPVQQVRRSLKSG
jgi:predicted nicotinamide N-methyase